MERAGRSRSLADLSSNSGKVTDTPPASHLSLYDVRDPPRYHKENLLDHGSPPGSPGYSTECDPSLLDIDSDNPETSETTGDMSKDAKMIIDNVMDIDNNRSVDPLHHQCKTARRMSFVDRLVSVTNDGTFGTSVTSPLPQIEHLTDHEGLDNTFHGSCIRKRQCHSQSIDEQVI
jgi:hypothetical protein